MLQLVLHPADPAKGQAAIKAIFDQLVQWKAATRSAGPGNAEMLKFPGKLFILYSFNDGAMVLTLNDKNIPDFAKLHADTVARRNGVAGLSADPEYALGRSRIGPAPEAWIYFGVFPWLTKNAQFGPMAAPVLAMAGLQRVQGCTLGATIEDRGFRTRLFVHLTPAAQPAAAQADRPATSSRSSRATWSPSAWLRRLEGHLRQADPAAPLCRRRAGANDPRHRPGRGDDRHEHPKRHPPDFRPYVAVAD